MPTKAPTPPSGSYTSHGRELDMYPFLFAVQAPAPPCHPVPPRTTAHRLPLLTQQHPPGCPPTPTQPTLVLQAALAPLCLRMGRLLLHPVVPGRLTRPLLATPWSSLMTAPMEAWAAACLLLRQQPQRRLLMSRRRLLLVAGVGHLLSTSPSWMPTTSESASYTTTSPQQSCLPFWVLATAAVIACLCCCSLADCMLMATWCIC